MLDRLFLVAALLSCCAGEASEDSVPEKIRASSGETVILPCHISVSDNFPTVEWSKEGLDPNIAFLYRDGCETYEMKNPAFRYRTNLIMNELKNGNISLRISNVQLSDAGKYVCMTIQKKLRKVVTKELVVDAVSEPKLSVVPALDGGLTLQCEANCWFPEPELTFLDDQGNNISAENPKTKLDSRGCFTVTRRVTVQTATNRVTCRVHQPKINQMRVAEIYIPDDCMRSCTQTTSIAVVVTIVLCALIAFLCKKFGNCVGGQKSLLTRQSSDHSTTRRNAVYTPGNQVDDIQNAPTEHLRKMDELKLNLCDKEEIIRKLTEELNDLRSKSPVVWQHGQPTINNTPSKSSPDVSKPINLPPHQFPLYDNPKPAASTNSNRPKPFNLPQNKDSKPGVSIQNPAPRPPNKRSSHNHSSPALLTNNDAASPSSSSAFTSEENRVVRTMSLSGSRPRPNSDKLQRRYTTSGLSSNRYSPLANLPEDSEL